VLRRAFGAGGLLLLGAALSLTAGDLRADDSCPACSAGSSCPDCSSCFAFFRRCPPEGGTLAAARERAKRLCRPPRCPPYCDPTFGYYPTLWRAWPTLYCAAEEDFESAPAPKTLPASPSGTTPGGAAPPTMPPAESDARRHPADLGVYTPTGRTPTELPALNGASER
jgi:hypothetical protein